MDFSSIDQVIQSTRESAIYRYSNRNHSGSNLSSQDDGHKNTYTPYTTSVTRNSSRSNQPSISSPSSTTTPAEHKSRSETTMMSSGITDFFSKEVFQMVLRNPTTSHRLLKFCQKRACGENMEFLIQIDNFNRNLDDLSKTLSKIQRMYTGHNAEREVNLPSREYRAVQNSIQHNTASVIPSMECIFLDSQKYIEHMLWKDVYPCFVKHQVTTSATLALAENHASSYHGLGDCFCLTDPFKADNPIVFASDGFVDVTGYTRREVVPRNCRFLQGPLTDGLATKRLRSKIGFEQETVELLLNYRKDGEPFWNLLYVSPLYDHNSKVVFFIGGQIDCSTTIHNHGDLLRILSLPEQDDDNSSFSNPRPSSMHGNGLHCVVSGKSRVHKNRSMFFKSWGERSGEKNLKVMDNPGVEGQLTEKFRTMQMGLDAQVEAFHTAYSKYLILKISPATHDLLITFYSPSMIEFLLFPQLANKSQNPNPFPSHARPASASIFNRDIFKVLMDQPLSAKIGKTFKHTVKDAVKNGKALSVEIGLMTGMEEAKKGGQSEGRKVEEKYLSHWTVLKDETGKGQWVVLTITLT